MTDNTREQITTVAERDVWAGEEMEWPWAMVTDAHGQPWIVYATEDDLFACTPPIEDERGLHAKVQVSDVIRHLDELDLPLTVLYRPDQPQRTEVTRPSVDAPMTSHAEIRAALEAATPGPWDEEWRAVPGQEFYEVSDQGRVRSWRAQTRKAGANPKAESPHFLKVRNSKRDGRGYQTVSLPSASGRYANATVHSLVMAAFVGPRPEGHEIAHLNGDPSDNRLVNLKYATHLENESHKVLHGTRATGEEVNGARLLGWQVAEIRYLAAKGVTQAKIAALFDLHSSHVSDIIRGRIWPETLRHDTASPTWLAELLAENERLTQERDSWRETAAENELIADDYRRHAQAMVDKRRDAEQKVERVRALHYHDLFRGHLDNGCKICGHGPDDSGYPCPTIRALDGDS